jgi:hypothetical protein
VVRPPGFPDPQGDGAIGGLPLWYTVCGREHTHYEVYVAAEVGLAFVGALLYHWMLRGQSTTLPSDKVKRQ